VYVCVYFVLACIEDFNIGYAFAMAEICFILFKVGFDFELLSMCIYAYFLI